jgi:hypothetical protein
MTGTVCPTCGRLWVCTTGTAASISPMPKPCRVCGGVRNRWDFDEPPVEDECPRCGGTGYDTPLAPWCLESEEHAHEPV